MNEWSSKKNTLRRQYLLQRASFSLKSQRSSRRSFFAFWFQHNFTWPFLSWLVRGISTRNISTFLSFIHRNDNLEKLETKVIIRSNQKTDRMSRKRTLKLKKKESFRAGLAYFPAKIHTSRVRRLHADAEKYQTLGR